MPKAFRFELNTPVIDDRPVFVSGNFCDWAPTPELFQMQSIGPGEYVLDWPAEVPLPEELEYKYNKGDWSHVELGASGGGVPNRISIRDQHIERNHVPHWRWYGQPFNPEHKPKLISDDFQLPQLNTTRRVNVLLPHDYEANPEKRYPVLYMHDGQNLIGEGTGFGSWNVDEKMAVLAARGHHEVILVTIDHGAEERIREYTLGRTKVGDGRGHRYLQFITQTLKPFIDDTFRTLPEPGCTGIGGSSLGGLISIYAGLIFPDVFGRLMVFSPALWTTPKIYFDAIKFETTVPMKIYAYGGEAESAFMVPNIKRFENALVKQKYGGHPIELQVSVDPLGEHNEETWGKEFPKALEWLYY
ncbi:carbohydrate esterase [Fibrisoma montanum]|uniref:Carbohydrate esterase n=1 Tax=Fibrisoma montanum TaxID=2305895 RepID=A0A418MHT6_9BACT|nr:alpha/beta hydrolase-fold protein [Fibrisoma montanum]RIV26989.1 carbohydrate esterase [Fibrisoma montanum]